MKRCSRCWAAYVLILKQTHCSVGAAPRFLFPWHCSSPSVCRCFLCFLCPAAVVAAAVGDDVFFIFVCPSGTRWCLNECLHPGGCRHRRCNFGLHRLSVGLVVLPCCRACVLPARVGALATCRPGSLGPVGVMWACVPPSVVLTGAGVHHFVLAPGCVAPPASQHNRAPPTKKRLRCSCTQDGTQGS